MREIHVDEIAAAVRDLCLEANYVLGEDVRRAFEARAFAVVVGSAITGIDDLVRRFVAATPAGARGSSGGS